MRIPLRVKFEKLVSRDQSRPVLCSLFLRIVGEGADRKGYLEGTDSYKLGRVPVELDVDDTEGFVPVEVVQAARKLKCETVRANGSFELEEHGKVVATFPRELQGQFPNTDQLMDLQPAMIEGARWTIGFSSRLLRELAEGLGTDGVELEFAQRTETRNGAGATDYYGPSNLRPITVRPLRGRDAGPGPADAVGILMPIRVSS